MARTPTPLSTLEERVIAGALSEKELGSITRRLAKVDEQDGVWLDEVNVLGTVQPDRVDVTVDVQPAKLPTVIKDLSGLGRPNIRIFPLGIVAPDRFRVEAQIRRR